MATAARTPDAELLLRLRARDRGAWEELYAEYQPRLRAFGLRLAGNPHDADDLVQETFVRALPRLDKLDPDTTEIAAYLFTTMRNLFLKQVERGKRQQPVAEVPEPMLPTPIEDDPERGTLLRRQQDEVRLANARLQPRQRLVLALRELEDRSYAEIGEIVGMKENAVAQLIFRARESLRTEMRLAQIDPGRLPEDCRRFLPLLAAHLDGQLKGARRDETLAHLDACERCQAVLADMEEASRRYRTLFPLVLGSDEARAAVERRLDAAGYWQGRGRGRGRLARRSTQVGAVVAAGLVLGGGAALGLQLSGDERSGSAAPTVPSAPVTTSRALPAVSTIETTATASPTPDATTPATLPVSPAAPPPSAPTTTAAAAPPPQTTANETPKPVAVPETTAKPEPAATPKPGSKPKPVAPPPDTVAPVVTITSAPAATTAVGTAAIRFTAGEVGVTFACSLDGGSYAACVSPVQLEGLVPGSHSFSVRATDKAGNVGKPASATWSYVEPDTTPPTVTITAAPSASTVDTGARFEFAASEPATFACSLDGGPFAPCSSPASFTSLQVGSHTLAIRATDEAGNVGPEASHAWAVVAPLPDLYVSAFTKFGITVSNKGAAAAGRSTLTITLVGTFTVPGLPPGGSAAFSWSTCRTGTYTAIVDRTKVVAEADESNNTTAVPNTCP